MKLLIHHSLVWCFYNKYWFESCMFLNPVQHLNPFRIFLWHSSETYTRADSRFTPSQWERSLQSNAVSHWLGTNLESALLHLSLDRLVLVKWTEMQVMIFILLTHVCIDYNSEKLMICASSYLISMFHRFHRLHLWFVIISIICVQSV